MSKFRVPYLKPVRSPAELVEHLRSKGLVVVDSEKAAKYLGRVSHYRFKGYALSFRERNDPEKPFAPGTTFDAVCRLMEFDAQLRGVVLSGIAPVELALRTAINEHMCQRCQTPFWYAKKTLFNQSRFDHGVFWNNAKNEFERSKELFVKHYKEKYDAPPYPPGWMLIETTSFGIWSCLFKGLEASGDKEAIAERFGGLPHAVLSNWFHVLSNTRNFCAHHSRLWNRVFGVTPKFLRREVHSSSICDKRRLGAVLYVVRRLHIEIGLGDDWLEDLTMLLQAQSASCLYKMGISEDWALDPLWKVRG